MEKNSFKLLEEEMESKFQESSEEIKFNINQRKHFWTLIGEILELYIPRVFNTLIGGVNYSSNLLENKGDTDN